MVKAKAPGLREGTTDIVSYPKTNLIDMVGPDDTPFPDFIQGMKGEEGGIKFEWDPLKQYEYLVGYLARKTQMTLGGFAYTLNTLSDYKDIHSRTVSVLLKKGGRVLEGRIEELGVQVGDLIAIMFLGEGEAKEKQNPPRLWKVRKLTTK